jgi:catalase
MIRRLLCSLCTDLTTFTVAIWAAVDQDLSDRIAKAVGAPTVQPLKAKPAHESVRFKGNFGAAARQ